MKRDFDLIRRILTLVEDFQVEDWINPCFTIPSDQVEDILKSDINTIVYNLQLLKQEGYIQGCGRDESGIFLYLLTWKGCDLLDSLRKPE